MVTESSIVQAVIPEDVERTLPMTYLRPFGPEEYGERLRRVREEMARRDIAVAIISDPKSVWWLAAGKAKFEYADNPIWLIVPCAEDAPVTAVVRYLERGTFERSASAIVEDIVAYRDGGSIIPYDPVPLVAEVLTKLCSGDFTVGIPSRYFNVLDYTRLRELLPTVQFVNYPVEQVRAIRSLEEQAIMRLAARANAQALYRAICELEIGRTEWDFAQRVHELHRELLGPDYGGSSISAQTAQFGPHAHDMHPKRLAVEMQTMVATANTAGNVEPGVFVKSYVGCLMRPIFFGHKVPAVVTDAVEASAAGLQNALGMMGPGVRSADVDRVIRDPMLKAGFEVRSRTGYGCGIEWDEGNAVSLAPGNPAELQEGHTLHVIAHSYGPYGFLGLSEQVVITSTGCEILASETEGCPRQLFLVS